MSIPPTRPRSIAKVVLVTGASSPSGMVLSWALAQQEWDLALHYEGLQPPASMLELVKECEKLGRRAQIICADLQDENQVKSLISRVITTLGTVTCLVNNATYAAMDDAADFSAAQLEQHMRTNVALPIVLARALHQATAEGSQAVVINLLDQKLFNPDPDFLSYTLSKAALLRATESLALALAPRIRVVGVAPALELHRAASNATSSAAFSAAFSPTFSAATIADDFAASICFIAGSTAITGATLLLDGGLHLRAAPGNREVIAPIASALSAP